MKCGIERPTTYLSVVTTSSWPFSRSAGHSLVILLPATQCLLFPSSPERADGKEMLCKWSRSGKSAIAGNVVVRSGECFYFVVERLPSRGWDWAVWHADHPETSVRHGKVRTRKAGVAAAENTAAGLCCVSPPDWPRSLNNGRLPLAVYARPPRRRDNS